MSSISSLEIKAVHVGRMLSDQQWQVPQYQRSYKWEKKQVNDLFDDIWDAIQKDKTEYFLGSIVATKTAGNRIEVVDGQQRLATVSLLLASVRDFFCAQLEDDESAAIVEGTYLFKKELKSKEIQAQLLLGDGDNEFFLTKVLARPSKTRSAIQALSDSHKRLLAAQIIARDKLTAYTAEAQDKALVLNELVEFLRDGVVVVFVQVANEQDAFTIFETLNDRGLDLAITDLLKNFLFKVSGARLGEVKERWTAMLSVVEQAVPEEETKHFLRHHWSSVHGLTREKELFSEIKLKVKVPKDAVAYAGELKKEASFFAAIRNGNQEFWAGYNTRARQHLQTITEILEMDRITPLLLAAMASFKKKELETLLKVIASFGARLLIAGGVGGTLERKYSDAAVRIRKKEFTTAKQVLDFLKKELPSDEQFIQAFSQARVSKSVLARYYLHALEQQAVNDPFPELVSNPNEADVNLEHILPQNPLGGKWEGFDGDAIRDYRYRLGNLALLSVPANSIAANSPFNIKKPILAQSKFHLTSEIGAYAKWNEASISDRQQKMAQRAVKAWPIKI